MLPDRLWYILQIVLCLTALATGGPGKKKNKKKTTEPTSTVPPPPEPINMCDIKDPKVIYCYCDTTEIMMVSYILRY